MLINRTLKTKTGGGIGITADQDSKLLQLTIWAESGNGRCEWYSVGLNFEQCIKVANLLLKSPGKKNVKLQDGTYESREIWQVITAKHGNGVTEGIIGIQDKTLGISSLLCNRQRTCLSDYFYAEHEVTFNKATIKILCGLLFYWAGMKMIGTKKVETHIVENVFCFVDRVISP